MKKLISVLIFISISLSFVCTPGYASEKEYASVSDGQYADVYGALLAGVEGCAASVDLSSYRIKNDELQALMSDFYNNEPTIFNLNQSYNYYTDGTYVTTIVFSYSMNLSQYENALVTVNSRVEELTRGISDSMSQFDRALILHDRIAKRYHYDTDLNNHTIYELITDGKGVCQAYALLYKYLLDKCGIESRVVSSETINHAWNIVKIDGMWYNVDVTWDDPVVSDNIPDITGLVYHKYFMNSDALSESLGHIGVNSSVKCTSTKYDKANFREITSSFENYKDELYCMKYETGLAKYAPATDSFALIYPDSPTWFVWGQPNRYYSASFSGIGLYGDYLVYSSPTAIKAYSFAENKTTELYAPDTSSGYIYGMTLNDGYVIYSITESPNSAVREYSYKLELPTPDKDPTALPFTDVKEADWFYSAVEYVYKTGLMSGTSPKTFDPNLQTSRAMLVRVLYNMEGAPKTDGYENPFADVNDGEWYADAIKWAYANNIVAGTSKTEYSPNVTITREQFAAILFRYAKYKNADVSRTTDTSSYKDFDETSTYAKEALTWANAMGYITGMSKTVIAPRGNATRAQMASILMRYNKDGE